MSKEIIASPDAQEKIDKGYNILLAKTMNGVMYIEAFKANKRPQKRDAGRIFHQKLWCENTLTKPSVGDQVIYLTKTQKVVFQIGMDRKITETIERTR